MSKWDTPVLHADLDAFYASVEILKDPALEGRPVIVGGTSSRGVVTSASYEARAFGVTSAMPTSRARRLCPGGVFIQPDFDSYEHYSHRVRDVFGHFSPIVEPLSLDEAFVDISGARRLWREPCDVAAELRRQVKGEVGLVVSVGVAPNKFLAKIASSMCKPDGMLIVAPDSIRAFLDPLPVGSLWGVGERTRKLLQRLGLQTIGDVAKIEPGTLESALGPLGAHVSRLAEGKDERAVTSGATRHSLSAEATFEHDLCDPRDILQELLRLSDRVGTRLRERGISGRTVTVKVRFSNFSTITRSKTLEPQVDGTNLIYGVAADLVLGTDGAGKARGAVGPRDRIRLLGVSLSGLSPWPPTEQLSLHGLSRWSVADAATDRIRQRFGGEALRFGSLLERE